jgi:hypothetical protein
MVFLGHRNAISVVVDPDNRICRPRKHAGQIARTTSDIKDHCARRKHSTDELLGGLPAGMILLAEQRIGLLVAEPIQYPLKVK